MKNKVLLFLSAILCIMCKDKEATTPSTPSLENTYPLEMIMISNSKNINDGVIEVEPGEELSFSFRATSDKKITQIDGYVSDWKINTHYLNGFPLTNFTSTSNNFVKSKPANEYDITFEKKIYIPNYAKDSIKLDFNVINKDNKKASKKIRLFVKNPKKLVISYFYLSTNNYNNSQMSNAVFGQSIYTNFGLISSEKTAKYKLSFSNNNVSTILLTDSTQPLYEINYSNYSYSYSKTIAYEINCNNDNYVSYNCKATHFLDSKIFDVTSSLTGYDLKISLEVTDESGDKVSSTLPLKTDYKPINSRSNITLGSLGSSSNKSFLLVSSGSIDNPTTVNSNFDFGYFVLSGKYLLGSMNYAIQNKSSLGLSQALSYGNTVTFKESNIPISDIPNNISKMLLDTVSFSSVNESIEIQSNSVILFRLSSGKKGILGVKNHGIGNIGFITLDVVYQTP